MTNQSTEHKMFEIGDRDALLTTLTAESATWYVCFGGPLPRGYPGGGTVESNGVFYAVKVGWAVDEWGHDILESEQLDDAKFLKFQVTPVGGKQGDPYVVSMLQEQCLAQLRKMLEDPSIPLYDPFGHGMDIEEWGDEEPVNEDGEN